MIKALPNLKSLSQELSHVVLLYDGSKDGYCFLGLGCKKSLEIGGDISELDVLNALDKFSVLGRWTFGWISYDVKNSFLNLTTSTENGLGLPDLAWWEPAKLYYWYWDHVTSVGALVVQQSMMRIGKISPISQIRPLKRRRICGVLESCEVVFRRVRKNIASIFRAKFIM